MHLEFSFWIAPNWPISWINNNAVKISWHDIIVNFFDLFVFLLSSLVSGPSVMSITSLVLELGQSLFIRDLTINPEIENTSI